MSKSMKRNFGMMECKSLEKPAPKSGIKKRKKKAVSAVNAKTAKLDPTSPETENSAIPKADSPKVTFDGLCLEEIGARFPVLKNEELVTKFLAVSLTNNQKGRIRQVLRDNLKGTADFLLPDVIHNRIQAILKSTQNLTDTDLRKIRILYNMLKTALVTEASGKKLQEKTSEEKAKKVKSPKDIANKDSGDKPVKKKVESDVMKESKDGKKEKEQLVKKVKGKKRYVVFLGNLPLQVNKDMIMGHFSEMNEHILDIRIPKQGEEKKSAIAYVELRNEPTYELALSKHHSMMGSKRINVLYTAQKNGKITEAQAKSKSAKLQALQKSGKLIGSTPLTRKRSQRRLKGKLARAKQENEN